MKGVEDITDKEASGSAETLHARSCNRYAVTDTHDILGFLVGAGIDQKPHTFSAAICSGAN